ncbi:MAG TPA: hypothetical protein VHG93_05295 [Longimicrobium sp.]|nr:hypothetical protein [Longimicrobium sp.]
MADASQMTVGGELNKLAGNIALFRNAAGVHWKTDYTPGRTGDVGEQRGGTWAGDRATDHQRGQVDSQSAPW